MRTVKLKVSYFTFEDVGSGLFRTQVIDILAEIVKQEPDIEFEIVVVNRIWHILNHKKHLRAIRSSLPEGRIRIKYIPLLPPLRNALKSYYFSLFITKWLALIYLLIGSKKVGVVHCRSYWPAKAAIDGGTIPVLFDMRSLWPAESVSTGDLINNSKSHHYWLELEANCLNKASVSTGVSKAMVSYAKRLAPSKSIELIPISVNLDNFRFNASSRIEKRSFLSWENETIVVYSGGFGKSGINYNALRQMFQLLLRADSNIKILFLTMESKENVTDLMQEVEGSTNRYQIIHPGFNEMSDWLSAGDIGVHALPLQLDSATRLGTKVVEYWANGLPVIVNENVGAAADFIEEYKVGRVLGTDTPLDNFIVNGVIESLLSLPRNRQSDFAREQFSSSQIARKYINAYWYCMKNPSA